MQLIESQHKLDFESLRYMAEQVQGSFTFSLLDENNSLYLVKGSNPLCLLHFDSLGLFAYASTESIMQKALKHVGLHKFASERIEADEGDIIRIDNLLLPIHTIQDVSVGTTITKLIIIPMRKL